MISLDAVTTFFGWTALINIGLLILSTVFVVGARSWVSRIHGAMFDLESADLSRAYFQYLAQYKIAVIVFSIAPYLALKLMA